MKCLDDAAVLEYLRGELPPERRRPYEDHIDGCASCRALVSAVVRSTVAVEPASDPAAETELDDAATLVDAGAEQEVGGELGAGDPAARDKAARDKAAKPERQPASRPQRAPAIAHGAMIDHFRVMRLLGRGTMGEVYLCRDSELGRRVAVKVVRAAALASPRAADRLLDEARTTAQFSHPHIVTLYSASRWHGLPYLVLEYVEGQTLQQRLERERPGVRETMRIAAAIAAALAEAHRHHVLHRDLKPANVLLARDGRLKVVDFGLALPAVAQRATPRSERSSDGDGDGDGGGSGSGRGSGSDDAALRQARAADTADAPRPAAGTPAYMAPEQWRHDELSAAADIWALGVILHELLTGRRPVKASSARELRQRVTAETELPAPDVPAAPPGLAELTRACLAKDPAQRPTATEVGERLARLLRDAGPDGAPAPDGAGPFRGLAPFDEEHAGAFFGREAEVAACAERLRLQGVLPLVGPSGAGKTSLVQAGVIPRLREQARWIVIKVRPGRAPFDSLAERLLAAYAAAGVSLDEPDRSRLARALEDSPLRLNLALRALAEGAGARVLLLVDQIEELCAQATDLATQRAFVEAVCAAGDDPGDPVRVVFTLRDDFLGRLARGPRVREALGQLFIVRSPEAAALAQIVTAPLSARGYRYDDETLPRAMVAEVSREVAALPLLQFATQLLWDRRDREQRLLERAAYDEMGGVAGALARHADGLLEGLTPQQVRVARELLLRLVTPEGTRQSRTRAELGDGLGAAGLEVLDRLTAARLLSMRRALGGDGLDAADDGEAEPSGAAAAASEGGEGGGEGDDSLYELAHESLVHNWARLARWIDESREELATLREVGDAARLWQRRGCRDEEVWRGEALEDAWRRLERGSTEVPRDAARFIERGRELERSRRARRRLRRALGASALVAVAVAALIVAVVMAAQRRKEREQRAAAQRESARSAMLGGDLLEARAKLRASLEVADSAQARLLWWRLARDPAVWKRTLGAPVWYAAFSPDGKTVAAAAADHTIHLFDARTHALRRRLRGHGDQVLTLAFSPDGKRLVSGSWNGEVWLWDLPRASGAALVGKHAGAVWAVRFGPRGKLVASGSYDKTARLWDVATRRARRTLRGHSSGIYGLAFDPGGQKLATGSHDRTVRLWHVATGRSLRVLRGHPGAVHQIAISPDGKLLASAGAERNVRVWDLASGAQRRVLGGFGAEVLGVAFSPDSRLIAAGSADRSVRLWRARSGEQLLRLDGHTAGVGSVDFSGDGKLLVSGGRDRTVRLWRVGLQQRGGFSGHTASVWCVSFSPDGRRLATGSRDGTLRLWDARTGRQLFVRRAHEGGVLALSFGARADMLVSAGADKMVRLWHAATLQQRRVLSGHDAEVYAVAVHPGGALVASGGADRVVRVWNAASGAQVKALTGHAGNVYGLSFSRDGTQLASASWDRTLRIWDVKSWSARRVLSGHSATVYGVDFSADGKQLVSGSADRTVRLWDIESGKGRVLARLAGRVYWLDLHPAGRHVGVPIADGTARLVRLASGAKDGAVTATLRGHRGEVNAVRFSPGGRLAATVGDDGTLRLWQLERRPGGAAQPRLRWRAPLLAGAASGNSAAPPRLLTREGWHTLRADAGRGVSDTTPASRQPVRPKAPAGAPPAKPQRRWARHVAARASVASLAAKGELLCAVVDGALELWSPGEDKRLRRVAMAAARRLIALPSGCLVLAAGRVRFVPRDGAPRLLAGEAKAKPTTLAATAASAMALSPRGSTLLVAVGREAQVFALVGGAPAPRPRARYPIEPGVTALTRAAGALVLGYRDGSIELVDLASRAKRRGLSFEEVPASPVERLLPGDMQTLAAGYANGTVGLWSLRSGRRLHHGRLHGPVVHLARSGARLYAASDLGQHLGWDLGVLRADYCAMLRQIWGRVPVTWSRGRTVLRPAPRGHRCAR